MTERVLMLSSLYRPLGVICWTKAIGMLWQGKASVVEETDRIIRSPSVEMRMPSVVRISTDAGQYGIRVRLNKKNVLHRDGMICHYCGIRKAPKQLNLDHVIPASRGGRKSWTNIVTSCIECNIRKADRTPEEAGMRLLRNPDHPNFTIVDQISTTISGEVPSGWKIYLPGLKSKLSK